MTAVIAHLPLPVLLSYLHIVYKWESTAQVSLAQFILQFNPLFKAKFESAVKECTRPGGPVLACPALPLTGEFTPKSVNYRGMKDTGNASSVISKPGDQEEY